MCSSLEELYEHVDQDQLPEDLGGAIAFDHREWIQQRAVSPPLPVVLVGTHRVSRVGFSDLRRRVPVEHKHYRHPLPKVCAQQFLHENGTQLCSYLVCRFVFGQG